MIWPRYRTELWHVGILHAPIAHVVAQKSMESVAVTWLPEQPSFCFLADPFGIWRDGCLTIFCEAFDYRAKRGLIRYYRYDADFQLLDHGEALRARHHLSYPYIIEDGGEAYMLPEAHRSGKLTLYRARAFPHDWEEAGELLPAPAIDPSVIFHAGQWWMFYSVAGVDGREMRQLHVAVADKLTGPWRGLAANPVRTAIDSARPGGTPFALDGKLYLPTQNCDGGYGLSISLLEVKKLTEGAFAARKAAMVAPSDFKIAAEGLHTLSACGPVTLFDVKTIDRSPQRALINIQRRLRRLRSFER